MTVAERPPVPTGWFAEQVHGDEFNGGDWVAVYQHSFGLCTLDGIWFATEAECNAFIAANLVGASWLGERPPPFGLVPS